jgi:hypothetical protein
VSDGTLQRIARQLAGSLRPLELAFRDPESFRVLLFQLGWDVAGLPPTYVAVADKAVQAAEALEALADEAELDEVIAVIRKAGDVYRAVHALDEAPAGIEPEVFLPELGRRLFELLLGRQLLAEAPGWFATLEALGVIVLEDTPPADGRPGFSRLRFDWDQLPAILSDPGLIPARLYGWGTDDLKFEPLAQVLGELVSGLGLPSSLDRLSPALAAALQSGATGPPAQPARRALTAVLFDVPVGGEVVEVGLMLAELPAEGAALPGVILQPAVPNGIAERVDLGEGWAFTLRAGTDLAQQLAVVVRPGEVAVRYPFAPGQPPPSGGFGIALVYDAPEALLLFGQPGRTRLELIAASVGLELDLTAGDLELKATAGVQGLALVLSPDDADSFLGAALGGRELRIDLLFGLGWSSRTGLDVLAGAGFAVTLYPHLDLGAVRFDRVDLALHLSAGSGATPALAVRASASFSGQIGPVAYSVDRLGVQLPVTFADGNAGPFDVRLEPLWPTGLGLVVDAGPVTGGGFVSFDPDKGRYVGVLQLDLFELGVSAIGILDTKDAAGRDLPPPGFSFLILIAADLPPIQLGFGFTLHAVGGLAAINRRLEVAALQAGARTGALDSILFPHDPVRDAPLIVSNLSTIFPVAMGRYVFGPMARLTWGVPVLLHIDLAIVLEVPDPVLLALIGKAAIAIPEDVAIIDLRIDVVGIIDFGRGTLAVDAALRDSRIADFPLAGEAAMRLAFAGERNFALAVGGLNPHYTPPAGFPALRRVSVALGDGDNPRISIEGYLAITTNSRQFGARAELYAAAGGFNVHGWLAFDALLTYSPLSFRFDFSVGMTLNRGSSRIAGVTVHGTLTGPSPFHVRGKATLSLLFFDISVPFDRTFGLGFPAPALPLADPWAPLAAAIAMASNWSGELPAGTLVAATVRAPADQPDLPLLHPMGVAVLRQKVVPLDRVLERFGEFEIGGPDRFDVAKVRVGGQFTDAWHPVTDHFAPGDFEALSDTEKLSRDSFEEMHAGVRVGADTIAAPLGALKTAAVDYETSILDAPWRSRPLGRFRPSRDVQLVRVATGAKAGSPLASAGRARFARDIARPPAVTLHPERYSVASAATLTARPDLAVGVTKGAAQLALKHAAGAATRAGLQVVPDHEIEPSP